MAGLGYSESTGNSAPVVLIYAIFGMIFAVKLQVEWWVDVAAFISLSNILKINLGSCKFWNAICHIVTMRCITRFVKEDPGLWSQKCEKKSHGIKL